MQVKRKNVIPSDRGSHGSPNGGNMARAGYCSSCEAHVWLDESGACVHGHPASHITEPYETETTADAVEAKTSITSRLGSVLSNNAREMTPGEIQLRQAEIEQERVVKAAEKALKTCTKTWGKTLKGAEKSLAEARAFGTSKLGSHGGITVWEHAVQTPHGTIQLEQEQANAMVDTAGALMETRRSTLTRMAAGGLLMGPLGILAGGMVRKKGKHDTRELYLVVESETVASIIPCDPNSGPRVRQLAASINMASRGAAGRASQRSQSVAQWTQHIADLRSQQAAEIAEAEAALLQAQSDTSAIDTAKALVEHERATPGK